MYFCQSIDFDIGNQLFRIMKKYYLCIVFAIMMAIPAAAQEFKVTHNEDDGFTWYETTKRIDNVSCRQATDIYGGIIIPYSRQYAYILYSNGYFDVGDRHHKGAGVCICDKNGKVVIPADRGYNFAYFNKEEGHVGYFCVQHNKLMGICDVDGKEIVKPIYETVYFDSSDNEFKYKSVSGEFGSTGIKLDETGHVVVNQITVAPSEAPATGVNPQPNSSGVVIFNDDFSSSSSVGSSSSSSSSCGDTYVTCVWCKGTGREVIEHSNNMSNYGVEVEYVTCSECGKRYDRKSTNHRHQTCSHCGGTGKQRVK